MQLPLRSPRPAVRVARLGLPAFVALFAFVAALAACAADRPRNRIEAPDDPAWWQALEAARPDAGTPPGADAGRDDPRPD